jgi:hypothetical protein
MAKTVKKLLEDSYADICAPAAIYLFIGLLVIAIDFTYFAQGLHKSPQHFITIVTKLVVIFLVTIFLNYLCKAGIMWLSAILAVITCIYLLVETFRMIQEKKHMAPYHQPPPFIHAPTQQPPVAIPGIVPRPVVALKHEEDYRLDQIIPASKLIGIDSRQV